MALLPWTNNYSVYIEKIDSQHKILLGYLNRLYDSMLKSEGEAILKELFDGMKVYAFTHFRTEEQLMFSTGYPDYEEHKKQHQTFVEKLNGLQFNYKIGDKQVVIELTNFLKNWLINHISGSDKIMGRYLKSKGTL
jgi:hemerythrin